MVNSKLTKKSILKFYAYTWKLCTYDLAALWDYKKSIEPEKGPIDIRNKIQNNFKLSMI